MTLHESATATLVWLLDNLCHALEHLECTDLTAEVNALKDLIRNGHATDVVDKVLARTLCAAAEQGVIPRLSQFLEAANHGLAALDESGVAPTSRTEIPHEEHDDEVSSGQTIKLFNFVVIGGRHVDNNVRIEGNVIGSALAPGASVTAGDIIAKISLSADHSPDVNLVAAVKAALEAIRTAKLPEPEQVEAAQTVEKIQKESEKTASDSMRSPRLKRWLDSLTSICKPAADAISAAKAVAIALGS